MTYDIIMAIIFKGVGGLGIFLLGMKYMSEGMQAMAGSKLRQLIHAATKNRFVACGLGIIITCIIQSSSVTTVMVVGFVNSGLMSLTQGIGVIIGANIGTTVTGWLLALNIAQYGLPILGVAAVVFVFARKDKIRFSTMTVMGIGMIFFGLTLMSDGFKTIRDVPEFIGWFSVFTADSFAGILKCALAGAILTTIVQSSSASLGITIGLGSAGVISFHTAAALILGVNIGTTITAFLASLGAGTNAKRTAYAHIVFNVVGALYIITLFPYYMKIIEYLIGGDPGLMVMVDGQETYPHIIKGIALTHSGFNIVNCLLLIPFVPSFARLLTRLIPETVRPKDKEVERIKYLLEEAVAMPHTALELAEKEQSGQVKKLIAFVDCYRQLDDLKKAKKTVNIEDIHESNRVILRYIQTFLKNLMKRDISFDLSEQLLNIMNRNHLIVSLEKSVYTLISVLENFRSAAASTLTTGIIESTETIIMVTCDALEHNDPQDREILLTITAGRGETMKKIRNTYLSGQEHLSPDDKSHILEITNLFERIVWLCNSLGSFLAAAR